MKHRYYINYFILLFVSVLTIKTVVKVVAGGISVASVLEVLKRESTFDQLVSAVNECVLPAGTSLIQITEGCICLTVRAENLSSLETLWSLYKDGTLKARLQDFFVTEEVLEELAGGEKLEVIVTIEEGEYQKALHELSSEIGGNLFSNDHPASIFYNNKSFEDFVSKPSTIKLKSTQSFVHSSGSGSFFHLSPLFGFCKPHEKMKWAGHWARLSTSRSIFFKDRFKYFSTTHLVKVLPFYIPNPMKAAFCHWSLGIGHEGIRRVLMGVLNSQLTTDFSAKYQLTTIFLANSQLTTNFG